eukprot:1143035-Pelagomonas_calceolata.AAC.1
MSASGCQGKMKSSFALPRRPMSQDSPGYKVTRGVGLQPKSLADRLLKSIDLKLSQKVEARQERNKVSFWKLGKSM